MGIFLFDRGRHGLDCGPDMGIPLSLPQVAIDQLKEHQETIVKAKDEGLSPAKIEAILLESLRQRGDRIVELDAVIDRLLENIHSLEVSNTTLLRRVESLERDRVDQLLTKMVF